MNIEISIDTEALKSIEKEIRLAAEDTMEQLKADLTMSQTMPFDTGDMQNNQTFVATDSSADEFKATLVTGSPQARRLYYHPEYNFQRGKNANAGASWLDPYLKGGSKEDFVVDRFSKALNERLDK